ALSDLEPQRPKIGISRQNLDGGLAAVAAGDDLQATVAEFHRHAQAGIAQLGVAVDLRLQHGGKLRAVGIAAPRQRDGVAGDAVELEREAATLLPLQARQRCRQVTALSRGLSDFYRIDAGPGVLAAADELHALGLGSESHSSEQRPDLLKIALDGLV